MIMLLVVIVFLMLVMVLLVKYQGAVLRGTGNDSPGAGAGDHGCADGHVGDWQVWCR